MTLPDDVKKKLGESLSKIGALTEEHSAEVLEALDAGKPIKWNLMLNDPVYSAKECDDETDD